MTQINALHVAAQRGYGITVLRHPSKVKSGVRLPLPAHFQGLCGGEILLKRQI